MITYKGFLTIPETDTNICIGCGACEFACPVRPFRAIYVDGNPVHLVAKKPTDEKLNESEVKDFPF
jgi:formate hydrogenlyase subunit 6/NADH:ubiquinone oxidoreductase subunit I